MWYEARHLWGYTEPLRHVISRYGKARWCHPDPPPVVVTPLLKEWMSDALPQLGLDGWCEWNLKSNACAKWSTLVPMETSQNIICFWWSVHHVLLHWSLIDLCRGQWCWELMISTCPSYILRQPGCEICCQRGTAIFDSFVEKGTF
jgi:hypothetical protein